MRPKELEVQPTNLIELTGKSLEASLKGKVLVQFDRFGQAMRNTYSLNDFQSLIPELIVCHYDAWRDEDVEDPRILSRERLQKERTKKSGTFYDVPFEEQIADFLSHQTGTPIFKVWFSTTARQELATKYGAIILSASPEKREFVEEKTHLPEILEGSAVDAQVRLASTSFPSIVEVPDYEECKNQIGERFVMQGKSIGGDGTKIIRTEQEFLAAREQLTGAIKLTEFFPGYSSNTTVVTVPNGTGGCSVYVDIPSHKPTGVPEVGVHETLGAGNDWSQAFPEESLAKFVASVEKIGQYLYEEQGLVGIWGVDSLWSTDGVKINEINCRLQGTTEASSINQILRNFPPFVTLHVLSFLGGDTSFLPSQSDFNKGTVKLGAQERLAPFYIKIKQKFDYPVRLKSSTRSGKYRLENGELHFVDGSISDLSAKVDDNEVIIADLPLAESVCEPGAELCTITGVTTQQIFTDEQSLSPISQKLVAAIYEKFEKYEEIL